MANCTATCHEGGRKESGFCLNPHRRQSAERVLCVTQPTVEDFPLLIPALAAVHIPRNPNWRRMALLHDGRRSRAELLLVQGSGFNHGRAQLLMRNEVGLRTPYSCVRRTLTKYPRISKRQAPGFDCAINVLTGVSRNRGPMTFGPASLLGLSSSCGELQGYNRHRLRITPGYSSPSGLHSSDESRQDSSSGQGRARHARRSTKSATYCVH